jgi:hypothetical protein
MTEDYSQEKESGQVPGWKVEKKAVQMLTILEM